MMILVLLLVLSLLGSCMCELSVEEAMLRLPKLELHAHLHGSVRRSTLLELAALDNATAPLKLSLDKYDHGLPDKPFELFPLVHGIVKSKEIVKRIVQEMIADYQQQNCIYLEIRTTPRSLPDGTSLEEYLALVVGVIGEHNAVFGEQMLVKLIVGVDRGKKYSDAVEALELATKLMYYGTDKVIVAMDFSGNPLGGRFQDFAEVFTQAKQRGFNVTVHTAEMKGLSERADSDETAFILSFGPDRMGHMLYPMERHYDQMIALVHAGHAPMIEICPTTAFYLLGLQSYADHPHFRRLLSLHYPVSVNTDDSGVFSTSLTTELLHVQSAFDLDINDITRIQAQALRFAFVSDQERERLKTKFWSMAEALADEHPSLKLDAPSLKKAEEEPEEIDMSTLYTM